MRIEIENIGIVAHADLSFNGLTVLAGPNSSGKTTVAKVLSVALKSILNKEQINQQYAFNNYYIFVGEFLRSFSIIFGEQRQTFFFPSIRERLESFLPEVIDANFSGIIGFLKLQVNQAKLTESQNSEANKAIEKFIEEIKDFSNEMRKLIDEYELPPIAYINNMLSQYFKASILSRFRIISNYETLVNYQSKIGKNDSIFKTTLNNINFFDSIINYEDYFISPNTKTNSSFNNVSSFSQSFILLIQDIIDGKIIDGDSFTPYSFQDRFGNIFEISEVASGIKSLSPLYILLLENKLRPNTVLIIDEPENNLHPEWQVKYAEIICKLVLNGVTVLLSTHSPIFLSAIQKYSTLNNIEKSTSYYLASKSEKDGKVIFKNYDNDVEQIINSLFRPFHRVIWMEDAI